MRYQAALLNSEFERVALVGGIARGILRERVNGVAELELETVDREGLDTLSPGTSCIRLSGMPGGGFATFRVVEAEAARERERTALTIRARHLLGDTEHELFADSRDCLGYTPASLMALVLGHSAYAPGLVEPSTVIPCVRFDYEPVFDCLKRLCTLTGGELRLNEADGTIDLLTAVGEDRGTVFRYGLNLLRAGRSIDIGGMANRVYGVGGGEPPLTTTGATASGGMEYAEDSDSVATWGLRETVYHEPLLEEVDNLVASPSLSGVYSGGLCAGWSNFSAIVSDNTDHAFIIHGTASQKVVTTADGEGIGQTVAVTPGTVYSLLANIIIVSGTVRVKIVDGTAEYRRVYPVTGTGLAVVRVENWKPVGGTVDVRIVQEGSGAAEFYVDSVQIAKGPDTKPFTAGSSADILWERTEAHLAANAAPAVTYDIDVVDLHAVTDGADSGEFGLGDTVTVVDRTLGLDLTTRVMEREIDLTRPRRVKVRLDTPRAGLQETLEALREAQEEGVRRARRMLAESSSAAETGSERLGFSNWTVRFSGAVTPTAWNAVSWQSGTLRVGDGFHAVPAGSLPALAGNSTWYCYFDRTAPGTFSATLNRDAAEGEDRVIVWVVTTTTSPNLCVIHAPGVIAV